MTTPFQGSQHRRPSASLRIDVRGAALVALLTSASCGPGDVVEITTIRVVPAGADLVIPGATSADRFGRSPSPAGHDHEHGSQAQILWNLPEGWTDLPGDGVSLARFQAGDSPDVRCTMTLLGGTGGGTAANVNRWRNQIGLAAMDETAVAALPRVQVLGEPATIVELEGTSAEGVLGLIAPVSGSTLFVKLTGPANLVDAQGAAFDAFHRSLRLEALHAAPTDAASRPSMHFEIPSGWRDVGPREMREVNLEAGSGTQCYVTLLAGEAGGVLPNLNRWRNELGLGPIAHEQVSALERVSLLGEPCPVLQTSESDGGITEPDASERAILATLLIRPNASVFVKMIGPHDEVMANKQAFLSFCESLEEAR